MCLPFGLNGAIDEVCARRLGIIAPKTKVTVGSITYVYLNLLPMVVS